MTFYDQYEPVVVFLIALGVVSTVLVTREFSALKLLVSVGSFIGAMIAYREWLKADRNERGETE